jgi:transposase InsO family protein
VPRPRRLDDRLYAWRERAMSGRALANARLLVEVRAIHRESRGTYGSPRMHAELEARGIPCSENRVARLMQRHGVHAKTRRRRFRCTTDSRHPFPLEQNRLAHRFAIDQIPHSDVAWAGDISSVWTEEGWLYLAALLDLHSRRVIGWAMQATMDRTLTLRVLQMALAQRRPGPGTLHHSDRGSQYACGDYRRRLNEQGITCSMSRKGDCWDFMCRMGARSRSGSCLGSPSWLCVDAPAGPLADAPALAGTTRTSLAG